MVEGISQAVLDSRILLSIPRRGLPIAPQHEPPEAAEPASADEGGAAGDGTTATPGRTNSVPSVPPAKRGGRHA